MKFEAYCPSNKRQPLMISCGAEAFFFWRLKYHVYRVENGRRVDCSRFFSALHMGGMMLEAGKTRSGRESRGELL